MSYESLREYSESVIDSLESGFSLNMEDENTRLFIERFYSMDPDSPQKLSHILNVARKYQDERIIRNGVIPDLDSAIPCCELYAKYYNLDDDTSLVLGLEDYEDAFIEFVDEYSDSEGFREFLANVARSNIIDNVPESYRSVFEGEAIRNNENIFVVLCRMYLQDKKILKANIDGYEAERDSDSSSLPAEEVGDDSKKEKPRIDMTALDYDLDSAYPALPKDEFAEFSALKDEVQEVDPESVFEADLSDEDEPARKFGLTVDVEGANREANRRLARSNTEVETGELYEGDMPATAGANGHVRQTPNGAEAEVRANEKTTIANPQAAFKDFATDGVEPVVSEIDSARTVK